MIEKHHVYYPSLIYRDYYNRTDYDKKALGLLSMFMNYNRLIL